MAEIAGSTAVVTTAFFPFKETPARPSDAAGIPGGRCAVVGDM